MESATDKILKSRELLLLRHSMEKDKRELYTCNLKNPSSSKIVVSHHPLVDAANGIKYRWSQPLAFLLIIQEPQSGKDRMVHESISSCSVAGQGSGPCGQRC